MSAFNPIHGFYGTKLYWVYRAMLKRCGIVKGMNEKQAERYANRGITVCDEWANNPKSFFEWSIKNGYEEGLQIDRIDNNGNYEPSNCRWVSQLKNKRNTSKTYPVACSVDGSEIVAHFDSAGDAADFLCIEKSGVLNCISAKQKTAGNYIFWRDNTRHERTCNDISESHLFECSKCGFEMWDIVSSERCFNYCPSCGAKVVSE